ncbi:MAG: M24 family metallopeptidase, partial [Campylobacter sp.]|nr:M24 family metallopeptidase [Campylobacter sp.]
QSKVYCFTKKMYSADFKRKAPYITLVDSLDIEDVCKKASKFKNKAFDSTLAPYVEGTALASCGFKTRPGFLEQAQEVKTQSELKIISKACHISARAFEIFKKQLKSGMSEKQGAALLESIMQTLGGQGLAFDTILAFGANTANPHHHNSDRKLKQNEPVLVDFGCKYKGYCSDITRSWWFGSKVSKEWQKTFDVVKEAHDYAATLAKDNIRATTLDSAARDFMDKAGFDSSYFIHSLGHGLGLKIHQTPYLSPKSQALLKTNSVFTIEPGLYYDDKFGIRYEDTFVLTPKGAKILTK